MIDSQQAMVEKQDIMERHAPRLQINKGAVIGSPHPGELMAGERS